MPTDLDERIAKAKAVVRDLEEALEFIRQQGLNHTPLCPHPDCPSHTEPPNTQK